MALPSLSDIFLPKKVLSGIIEGLTRAERGLRVGVGGESLAAPTESAFRATQKERERISKIPTTISATPKKSPAQVIQNVINEIGITAMQPSTQGVLQSTSSGAFGDIRQGVGAAAAFSFPPLPASKGVKALSEIDKNLIKTYEKGVTDFTKTRLRPLLADVSNDGKVVVQEGTGRLAKTTEKNLSVYVPSNKIPTGAKVVKANVPIEEVRGKNLVSSRGIEGANPLLIDTATAGKQYAEIVVPKRMVSSPFLDAEKLVKERRSILQQVDDIIAPVEKKTPTIVERITAFPEKLRTSIISQYTPLASLEKNIYKVAGKDATRLDMARSFEQVAGAPAKGEADLINFQRKVLDELPTTQQDFNRYLFLRRTGDRLATDPTVRQVGDWTSDKARAGLKQLEAEMGPEKYAKMEGVAGSYQKEMDNALQMQVQSGRMSEDMYKTIKASNDFYAPFKVMKYLDEETSLGAGARIATTQDFTKAITGIHTDDFNIKNPLLSSMENIYKSRLLAEKNMKMLELDALADMDEGAKFIKRITAHDKVKDGYTAVKYLKDGKTQMLEVPNGVAESLNGLNATQAGLLMRTLAGGSSLARFGITSANAAFQIVNLLFADLPQLALISKFGLKSPLDLVRFPLEFMHGFYSSMRGNVFGKPNELYMKFLQSGAANSTIAKEFAQGSGKFRSGFNIDGVENSTLLRRSTNFAQSILNTVDDFANAFEETAKLTGMSRGLKDLSKLPSDQKEQALKEMITEIRNYSGSPDFSRRGIDTKNWNTLFMFFNARLQGVSGLMRRLSFMDKDAKASASAWARLSSAVGIPALSLAMLNSSDEYKDDYNQIPQWERDNYFMIPKNNFVEIPSDKELGLGNPEKVRDYWRIPKREAVKLFANMIETGHKYAQDNDPAAMKNYAISFLENISPIGISGDSFQQRVESVVGSSHPYIKSGIEFGLGRNTFYHTDTVPNRLKTLSPENQWLWNTPEAYKTLAEKMPDFMPESLRSPVKLEQLSKSLTGGLLDQFFPKTQPAGREVPGPDFIGKRFIRSTIISEEELTKEIDNQLRKQGDMKFLRQNEAMNFIKSLNGLNKQEKIKEIIDLKNQDIKLLEEVITQKEAAEKGLSYNDYRIASLNVKDGQRAEFIVAQLKKLPKEERKNYIVELAKKGIVTDAVADQMAELYRE